MGSFFHELPNSPLSLSHKNVNCFTISANRSVCLFFGRCGFLDLDATFDTRWIHGENPTSGLGIFMLIRLRWRSVRPDGHLRRPRVDQNCSDGACHTVPPVVQTRRGAPIAPTFRGGWYTATSYTIQCYFLAASTNWTGASGTGLGVVGSRLEGSSASSRLTYPVVVISSLRCVLNGLPFPHIESNEPTRSPHSFPS